jgi:exosome complex RNA-binding protein Csl4
LEYVGLHNKPKAEVHPGQKLTGQEEEKEGEEEEEQQQQPNILTLEESAFMAI